MASPRHPTTIETLPSEVLSNIFIQLLAKQLAQMRCVSKSWNALLSHPSFVKSHLQRSIDNNGGILLFFRQGVSSDFTSFTARNSHSPNLELSTDFLKVSANPQSKYIRGGIIGSVNGLICFYYKSCDADYVIHICNPSLSATLTLPPYLSPSHYSDEIHFRFGFDPENDDYKVVKLTSFPRAPKLAPQVEVYSMRKGTWELISERFPSHVTVKTTRDNVCGDGRDGHLHWLGYIDIGWKMETMVSFDLSLETFRVIPFPDSVQNYHGICMNAIGVLSGKLCVMSRIRFLECEVWVMDEYGVAESWVKHHAFSLYGDDIDIYPYGFTLQGEFLFHVYDDLYALHDPIAEKVKTFKIMGGELGEIKVVEYVDSLIWVTPS